MGSGIGKRAHEKALSALDRIGALESGLQNVANGAQQAFVLVEQRLGNIEEMVAAVVNIVGAESVRDQVVAAREAQKEARIVAAKNALAEALEKEQLLPLEKLPPLAEIYSANEGEDKALAKGLENILLVGREIEKDGTVAEPGRVQQPLGRILPDIRAALADKTIGGEIPLPEDRKFVVDELYIENPNPPVVEATPPTDAAIESLVEAQLNADVSPTPAAQ